MASDLAITMLPNSPEVEEIVMGEQGILAGACKGLIITDMSTIAPATSRKLGEVAAEKGAHFLDTPVSGNYEFFSGADVASGKLEQEHNEMASS